MAERDKEDVRRMLVGLGIKKPGEKDIGLVRVRHHINKFLNRFMVFGNIKRPPLRMAIRAMAQGIPSVLRKGRITGGVKG